MSEETEIKNEKLNSDETIIDESSLENNGDVNEETSIPTLTAEEELTIQVKEANDKYLRIYSEFDNYRRRTAKEKLALISTAGSDVLKSLLPVLDDCDRAFLNEYVADDPEVMEGGFGLIHKKLISVLEHKGLKPMNVKKGDVFDTDIHEAIAQVPAPDNKLKGTIIDIVEKGYMIDDTILRHAKVVIGN